MSTKKCFQDLIGFNDRWMLIIGIPLASLIVSLLLFSDLYTNRDFASLSFCFPISMVYTTAFWVGMRKTYHLLRLRYPAFEEIGKRIIWAFGAFLVVYFVINNGLGAFFMYAFPQYMHGPNPLVVFVVSLVLSALVMAIYEASSFRSSNGLTQAYCHNEKKHFVDHTLEELERLLDPREFFRISRNMTLHLKAIQKIHPYLNGRLKLEIAPQAPEEVMVSRERTSQFKSWLGG